MEARPSDVPDQTPAEAKDWLTEADRLLPGGLLGRGGLPRHVRGGTSGISPTWSRDGACR